MSDTVPLRARAGLLPALLFFLSPVSGAQDPPLHADHVGGFFQNGSIYADVWGDGAFAYVGHWSQNEIDILDLSNPASPSLAANYVLGSPNTAASAQDVKVASGLLFIALESGGSDGVEIVDVRNPASPAFLTRVDVEPGPYELIHNMAYDQGWLYLCDSANPSIAIVDLRSYDPDNPPAAITSWRYELVGVGNSFVHDITVANGRLWVSAWDSTQVFDVSALGTQAPTYLGQALGVSAHAVWPTDDGRFVVSTEERGGGALRLYEVIDHGSSVELIQRDSFASPRAGSNETYSAHNPVMVGDRIYMSNYSAGVAVMELDRTSMTLEKVASYDTSTEPATGFAGCWGVYPLLGEDTVLASDIESGFHVLDMGALSLASPGSRPTRVPPDTATSITVQVSELGRTLAPASVELYTSIDGAGYVASAMTAAGGGTFVGSLPAVSCGGRIDYYFRAADTAAEVYTKPADAPASPFSTWATYGLDVVLADDFEVDRGWTVSSSGLSSGAWVRGDPNETGAQPGEGERYSPGVACYFTGQAAAGASLGTADVDGGPTRLSSPVLDFSSGDGLVHYSRWLFNDDVDSDALVAEISNDGGGSWTTLESVSGLAGGWVRRTFRVSDHVAPTDQVVVRFSVSDNPNDSVTEAAVDEFRAELFGCPVLTLATATERNGSGVNPACLTSTGLPVLGTNWTAEIDGSFLPTATATLLVAYDQPVPGLATPYGELLVGGQRLLRRITAPTNGVDAYSVAIPGDAALAGLNVHAQGVVLGQSATLCNAVDLVLGY